MVYSGLDLLSCQSFIPFYYKKHTKGKLQPHGNLRPPQVSFLGFLIWGVGQGSFKVSSHGTTSTCLDQLGLFGLTNGVDPSSTFNSKFLTTFSFLIFHKNGPEFIHFIHSEVQTHGLHNPMSMEVVDMAN